MMANDASEVVQVADRPSMINRDWTRRAIPSETDFQRFTRDDVDWNTSPLGAPVTWPAQFRQMVQIALADNAPSCVIWGIDEEMAIVYNENYAFIIGNKHPAMQGQQVRVFYPEIWPMIWKIYQKQIATGLVHEGERSQRLLYRNGFLEECYISQKLLPILSPEGFQVGFYVTISDYTAEVLQERSTETVQALDEEIAKSNSLKYLWQAVLKGLSTNEYDVPLAILFSLDASEATALLPSVTVDGRRTFVLEGTLGIEKGHKAAPERFDLTSDTYELACRFREAEKRQRPLEIRKSDDTLPAGLFDGVQWRGHGVECESAVLCVIRAGADNTTVGFLLIGINPLRPYDVAYKEFVRFLTQQLTSPRVSHILLQEELETSRAAASSAALELTRVSNTLAAKTAEFEQSEPTLVKFADLLKMGIGIATSTGHVLYENSVWRHFAGLPGGSTERFDFMKCTIPEDEEALWKVWHDLAGGSPVNAVLRFKAPWSAPSGEQHPTSGLITGFAESDGHGETTLVATVTDVSELKWIEAQLRQRTIELEISEKKYRQFAELAPVGVAVMYPSGGVHFSNESFDRIMAPPAPHGDILDCVYSEDLNMVSSVLDSLSASNRYVTFECRLKKRSTPTTIVPFGQAKEDMPRWILASAYMEADPEPRIICWVTDITAQKAAQDVIRRRMDEALEMKRQQEHFIDMTSHEIRNPLSALIHCVDEIIENTKSEPAALAEQTLEAAQTIEYCAKHIRTIVGDVLTLSKLDSKLVEICPVAVRPQEIIQAAVHMFAGETRAADIDLHYHEDQSVRDLGIDWLMLDPGRVHQVLVNLLTNAIKFTKLRPERRISVRLSAATSPPDEDRNSGVSYVPRKSDRAVPFDVALDHSKSIYLIVGVQDTGCGLGNDQMEVLFQRFKQASPKTEMQYGGSGLGLFICRDLCELQGGNIGVSSVQDSGSTFVFYVETKSATAPAQPPSIEVPTGEKQRELIPAGGIDGAAVDGIQKHSTFAKRILVVEDNELNAKILLKQLRKRSYEIVIAGHGERALELLRCQEETQNNEEVTIWPFDLVLMDMYMPVMDGLTCTREIRRLEREGKLSGKIPIIAVTANVRDELLQAATAAGVDGITTKPYRVNELVAEIERLCPG